MGTDRNQVVGTLEKTDVSILPPGKTETEERIDFISAISSQNAKKF